MTSPTSLATKRDDTDAGLQSVGRMARLETLNLYLTKITDAGLSHFEESAES